MKKMFFLVLVSFLGITASMNAQVRIGGEEVPNTSAVLDLNATDATNNGTLGLALPRVALTSTTDETTIKIPKIGLTVYNTVTAGTGSTAVVPGIYYFNGNNWAQVPTVSAPIITTQPAAFSFSRAYDVDGDPNSTVTSYLQTLSVTALNATGYQWYKRQKNVNAPAVAISGATSASYDVTIPIAGAVDWGLYAYYCVVSNAFGSVKSDWAEIALGCGAKTDAPGGWLKFMCHNLGATPVGETQSLDDITIVSDNSIEDAKGWLFEWGRDADGHQLRTATGIAGPYTGGTRQVPDGDPMYGKYIANATAPGLWNSTLDQAASASLEAFAWNPCPAGWYLPTLSHVRSLFTLNNTNNTRPTMGALNDVLISANGARVRPDGLTTTVFFPLAGQRWGASAANIDAGFGHYWINDEPNAITKQVWAIGFVQNPENASHFANPTARGKSVRCWANK